MARQTVEIVNNNNRVEIYSTPFGGERRLEGRYKSFKQAARRKFLSTAGHSLLKSVAAGVELTSYANMFLGGLALMQNRLDLLGLAAVEVVAFSISGYASSIRNDSKSEVQKLANIRTAIDEAKTNNNPHFTHSFSE
jgi:hypothetical protein